MGMLLHRHDFEEADKKVSSTSANNKNNLAEKPEIPTVKSESVEPVKRGRKRAD